VRRAALIVAAFCATASDAAAAQPLHATVLGPASRMIGSDRTRLAAWQSDDGTLTFVYDDVTGATTSVATPAKCTVNAGAVGGGALVATCDAPPLLNAAQVFELGTGRWREVVPAGQLPGIFTREFFGIGTQWIEGTLGNYGSTTLALFARSDGTRYTGPSAYGVHVQPSLDAVQPRERICSPLRAPLIQMDGRYGLSVNGLSLVLGHCGSKRQKIVCRRACFSPALDHGHVLWDDDRGRLHVRGVRARRGRIFAIPGHRITAVHPTGSRLILSTDQIEGTARVTVMSVSARDLGIG
jgi:hypothetical protein